MASALALAMTTLVGFLFLSIVEDCASIGFPAKTVPSRTFNLNKRLESDEDLSWRDSSFASLAQSENNESAGDSGLESVLDSFATSRHAPRFPRHKSSAQVSLAKSLGV